MSIVEAEKFRDEAETEFKAGKIQDAIINIKAAILELNWHVTEALQLVPTPRQLKNVRLPELGRVEVPREITEYLQALETGLEKANQSIIFLMIGMDHYKYRAFMKKTPSVSFSMAGTIHAQLWGTSEVTEETYRMGQEVFVEYREKSEKALANPWLSVVKQP